MTVDKEMDRLMDESRIKNFRVTVKKSVHSGEIELSTTHNGFQWTSLRLNRTELELMQAAIGEHLKFGYDTERGNL